MSPIAEKILALLIDGYRAEPEEGYYRLVKRAPDVAPGNAHGVSQAVLELEAAGYLDFAANGSRIAWLNDKGRAESPPKMDVPVWIPVGERLPAGETPVLILYRGAVRIGELRWEHPGLEDTYKAFRYWDDPVDDGQCWEWPDITHWMPLPAAPDSAPEGCSP